MKYVINCLLGIYLAGSFSAAAPAETLAAIGVQESSPLLSVRVAGFVQRIETPNFDIQGLSCDENPAKWATAIESLRSQVVECWTPDQAARDWAPKCKVILHANQGDYVEALGPHSQFTIGSSYVGLRHGQITSRRIDIRADRPNWLMGVMAHELTHMVLADQFGGSHLPIWADEGMAVLADPNDKQSRHLTDLDDAFNEHNVFRMIELLSLTDYPDARRQAAFYGQSASVAAFLARQATPAQFVKFLQMAAEIGYDEALRQAYGIAGVADLESRWQADARQDAQRQQNSLAGLVNDWRGPRTLPTLASGAATLAGRN